MNLKENFDKNLRNDLKKELGLKNTFEVPTINKIVINMGVGKNKDSKPFIEEAIKDMLVISGQSPSKRIAKTSISNFKLRKGQLTGLTVTLRGNRMWEFYEKFVTIVLPRVKDFRGVNEKSFDGQGNYSLGLSEHIVFPEIDANKVIHIKPLQVTITTSAKNNKSGLELLKALQMPFRK
jgi:large subunit ribosomal protein L5